MQRSFVGSAVLPFLSRGTYWLVEHPSEPAHADLANLNVPGYIIAGTVPVWCVDQQCFDTLDIGVSSNTLWTQISQEKFDCLMSAMQTK